MNNEKCPCCSNRCSIDNLGCGRGEKYFENRNDVSESKTVYEQVISDLRKCGHILHHNRDLNTDKLLSNFSEEELNKLHELLAKIYNNI